MAMKHSWQQQVMTCHLSDFTKEFKDSLLRHYIEDDRDIQLVGHDFQVSLKFGIITRFIPVMASALNRKIPKDEECDENRNKIEVNGFSKSTVNLFVKIMKIEPEDDIAANLNDWQTLLNLIKFCHFYKCMSLFIKLLEVGREQVNKTTIYEAIDLVIKLDFVEWNDTIVNVISNHSDVIETAEWNNLLQECPILISKFLTRVLRKNVSRRRWSSSSINFVEKTLVVSK